MKSATAPALLLAMMVPALAADGKSVPLTGTWKGSYLCGQGLTGLTLSLDQQSGEAVLGTFHFYPLPSNPAAKEGCFAVAGHIFEDKRVFIGASTWITQPKDYITVDLEGRIAASGKAMKGDVKTPYAGLCSVFSLIRTSPAPSADKPCQK
ncbi:hypothetical protein GCM10007874_47800 [Labrys miyagiensis]|uniref:DUF2147 domain-containing protein n=2 Tax=Labrys miyagiensis TaxID=346912 RepID=A0ABQ6CN72_9HYPH|nr:hypothetical protein GCM10007874_47800 [Labrys miyagiensis]